MPHSPRQRLKSSEMIDMAEFCAGLPVRIDLAYARDDNLLFGERIYRAEARLYLHKNLARIVREAGRILSRRHPGLTLVLHDGLRTVEAQAAMEQTRRVRENRHWLEGTPRLLSPPGQGGHPRGMAVDVSLERDGAPLDMGTAFDFLAEDASPARNQAHRDHPHLSNAAQENRKILDDCMMAAAKKFNIPLMGLPEEWWDYRLPPEIYNLYEPLSDADLPPAMRMVHSINIDAAETAPE